MLPYLQTEFRNKANPTITPMVLTNKNLLFDTTLAASFYEEPSGMTPSITYDDETGIFGIKQTGVYLVNWFVSQQTGLSTQGANFGITIDLTSNTSQLLIGSGHVKLSPTQAFAIINVTEQEANSATGKTFALTNVSSHDAALSRRCQVKAGLAIFGISQELFEKGYGHWQATGWNKISNPYLLMPFAALKFNHSILEAKGIIATDSEDGIPGARIGFDTFTIQKPGVYQISWEIPIEATNVGEEVEILLTLNGTTAFSRSYVPIPLGVISGTAIVKVEKNNGIIQLINHQTAKEDIIQIGHYANLAMHRIS